MKSFVVKDILPPPPPPPQPPTLTENYSSHPKEVHDLTEKEKIVVPGTLPTNSSPFIRQANLDGGKINWEISTLLICL